MRKDTLECLVAADEHGDRLCALVRNPALADVQEFKDWVAHDGRTQLLEDVVSDHVAFQLEALKHNPFSHQSLA